MSIKQPICAVFTALFFAIVSPAAYAADGAPIAENMKLSTYRGVSVDGQLNASDPEGDPIIAFTLTTPPVKGEVVINADGSFVYTPKEHKRGKDYFGYTATDSKGNVSQEATVIITLLRQKTDVTYSDMLSDGGHYDALRLAEEGIFIGEQVGNQYVFSPNTMISRGEFLSMCVALSDTQVLSGASNTGFADDENIPHWQKRYISTARVKSSLFQSARSEDMNFNSTAPITYAEAAVMVDSIYGFSKVSAASISSTTPDWATQSVTNLTACNVLPKNVDTAQYLNRDLTADLLSGVMDVLEQR